jgi:hypothetical protein
LNSSGILGTHHTDWVEFALDLAEKARAVVREDTKRLEALRQQASEDKDRLADDQDHSSSFSSPSSTNTADSPTNS